MRKTLNIYGQETISNSELCNKINRSLIRNNSNEENVEMNCAISAINHKVNENSGDQKRRLGMKSRVSRESSSMEVICCGPVAKGMKTNVPLTVKTGRGAHVSLLRTLINIHFFKDSICVYVEIHKMIHFNMIEIRICTIFHSHILHIRNHTFSPMLLALYALQYFPIITLDPIRPAKKYYIDKCCTSRGSPYSVKTLRTV